MELEDLPAEKKKVAESAMAFEHVRQQNMKLLLFRQLCIGCDPATAHRKLRICPCGEQDLYVCLTEEPRSPRKCSLVTFLRLAEVNLRVNATSIDRNVSKNRNICNLEFLFSRKTLDRSSRYLRISHWFPNTDRRRPRVALHGAHVESRTCA